MAQPFQLGQQERLAHLAGQSVEQAIDFDQGFQRQGAAFRRWRLPGLAGMQRVQIGAFDVAAAEQIDHQTMRDRHQIGARLAAGMGLAGAQQHFQIGVVGQVRGIERQPVFLRSQSRSQE